MAPKKVNPQKASVVTNLKDLLSQSKSVAVVDYTGLKVSQATDLRRAVASAGGQYLVAKNTLFKIASGLSDLKLEGLSGFIFSLSDEVSALKAAAQFSQKNSVLTFKTGLLGDKVLSSEEVKELATLPDKPALAAKLVGTLNSPLFRLASSLNWNISKLVRTLSAISALPGR